VWLKGMWIRGRTPDGLDGAVLYGTYCTYRTVSFVGTDDLNDLATGRWSGDVLRRLGTSASKGFNYVVGPLARQEDVRSGNDRVALHGGSPHFVPIRGLIGNVWRDDAMAGKCDGGPANRMGNEGANRFLISVRQTSPGPACNRTEQGAGSRLTTRC
jgi:hypothetical protein